MKAPTTETVATLRLLRPIPLGSAFVVFAMSGAA
jgi:hypothetical protein